MALTLLIAMEGRLTAGASSRREGPATWHQMCSVLTPPRCINCHTATNYPEQGDDRHPHLFNVVRGQQDHGVPAITCAACYQRTNAPMLMKLAIWAANHVRQKNPS